MDINELKKLLYINKVPNYFYNLDGFGRKDERFCIENVGNEWIVYFTERGIKTTLEKFNTEDAACSYLFNQLIDNKK